MPEIRVSILHFELPPALAGGSKAIFTEPKFPMKQILKNPYLPEARKTASPPNLFLTASMALYKLDLSPVF